MTFGARLQSPPKAARRQVAIGDAARTETSACTSTVSSAPPVESRILL